MMNIKSVLVLFCLSVFYSCVLISQEQDIYKFSWKKEKYIIGGGIAVLGTAFIIDQNQTDITEQEVSLLDPQNISSFNRSAIFNLNEGSAKTSDIFRDGALLLPLSLFLTSKGKNEWQEIASMYVEVLSVNTALTFITQSTSSRVRPFIYNNDIPIEERTVREARRSFYSGHVSHVASMSFFTASVLSDLYPDSNYKWLWWSGAISLPAITAYLRYDAGRHFPTDVMVGYTIGSAIGYFLPKFHKVGNGDMNFSLIPSSSGLSLGMRMNLN
tara:strand:- start:2905 stop:3717 length:813 start_codon:yes stop_codon:yes gene_type:complete